MSGPASDNDYYELRMYEMIQARMEGMHDIMGRVTPPLFARHGFRRPLALWEGFAGPIAPIYGYLIRWSNLDDRMRAWGNFYSDPEWLAAMTANYEGEQRVERAHICFMRASPVWAKFRGAGDAELDGRYELRRYDLSGLDGWQAAEDLSADLVLLERNGGRVLGVFDVILGSFSPQTVVFVAWPGAMTMRQQAIATQNSTAALQFDSYMLRPARYGIARENFAAHPEIAV